MNDPFMVAGQWFDGDLTAQQFDELCEWLNADVVHAQQFAALSLLEVQLRESLVLDERAARQAAIDKIPSAPSYRSGWPSRWNWINDERTVTLIIAGLVVTIIVLTLDLIKLPAVREADRVPAPSRHDYVARLVDMRNAHWKEQEGRADPVIGDDLLSGQLLDLAAGAVELRFDDGARVVLHGPCQFQIEGRRSGRLIQGSLAVLVTKPQNQFIVETALARVTDLGTEFGVAATDQFTDVIVRDGVVSIDWTVAGGNARRTLRAGEFIRLERNDSGEVQEVADQLPPAIAWQVRSPRPIASFKSNSLHNYRVVPAGFGEGAVSHTDREYRWIGVSEEGIPSYLVGGDYVQTAMNDKTNGKLKIELGIAVEADLYLLVTQHPESPPAWVREMFTPTGDVLATRLSDLLDGAKDAPGSLNYDVWRHRVQAGQSVTLLAPQDGKIDKIGAYGIVVVPIEE